VPTSPLTGNRPLASLPRDWPSQPPPLETADDVRAAYDWFRAERQRLEEYTHNQITYIQQQHYDVLARHYQVEADTARRVQEVNREMQFLAAQAEAMRDRARGLAEWEEGLNAQTEHLARLQQDNGGQTEQERAAALAALRQEMADWRLSEAAARAKFDATDALIRERQAVWEKKQAEVQARQEQLERRCRDLQRAEEALARRVAEMDEVEKRLLQDLDDAQGSAVARKRAQQEEFERRCRDLQRAEEALARRMAELEEVERRAQCDLEHAPRPLIRRPARGPVTP
jgi:chromosome segregation ATPase